jgi:23S rRNA (adenine2503-C2)-methyltransferase
MGRISKEGMFWQLDYMISRRYPDSSVPVKQLKVHFTRMGEPSFNMAVLDVINEFEWYWQAPGFMPSISSIAPNGSEKFFEELLNIKNKKFFNGNFQLQFSIHTTDEKKRDAMMPVKKWSFEKMAAYGRNYKNKRDRKVTLSFAPSAENEIYIDKLKNIFDPAIFLIKLTPLNETGNVLKNNLSSVITGSNSPQAIRASDRPGHCGGPCASCGALSRGSAGRARDPRRGFRRMAAGGKAAFARPDARGARKVDRRVHVGQSPRPCGRSCASLACDGSPA